PSNDAMNVHIYIREGYKTLAERVDIMGARVVPAGSLQALLGVSRGESFVPLNVRADQARMIQHYASIGYPMTRIETSCRLLGGSEVQCDAPQLAPECRATSLEDLRSMCTAED